MTNESLLVYHSKDLPKNYVYIWKRLDGTPFYVGVGRNNRHKSLARRNKHVLGIVNKLGGIDKIPKEIIAVANWEAGCKLEIQLIAKYGRSDLKLGPLANQTDGGEGTINKLISQRVRDAVGKANSRRVWSAKSRNKHSKSMTGRLVTDKTRRKLANTFKGKSRPAHVLAAMREGTMKAIAEGRHGWVNTDAHKRHFKNVVQEKAKEWHKSSKGLEFHKKLGKLSWETRLASEVQCQFCKRIFLTPYPTRAKYCHTNCKQSAHRQERGLPVGTRPASKHITEPKRWSLKKGSS